MSTEKDERLSLRSDREITRNFLLAHLLTLQLFVCNFALQQSLTFFVGAFTNTATVRLQLRSAIILELKVLQQEGCSFAALEQEIFVYNTC